MLPLALGGRLPLLLLLLPLLLGFLLPLALGGRLPLLLLPLPLTLTLGGFLLPLALGGLLLRRLFRGRERGSIVTENVDRVYMI